jgi:hypothetical protein
MQGKKQNLLQLYNGKWLTAGTYVTDFSTQVRELKNSRIVPDKT